MADILQTDQFKCGNDAEAGWAGVSGLQAGDQPGRGYRCYWFRQGSRRQHRPVQRLGIFAVMRVLPSGWVSS